MCEIVREGESMSVSSVYRAAEQTKEAEQRSRAVEQHSSATTVEHQHTTNERWHPESKRGRSPGKPNPNCMDESQKIHLQ